MYNKEQETRDNVLRHGFRMSDYNLFALFTLLSTSHIYTKNKRLTIGEPLAVLF